MYNYLGNNLLKISFNNIFFVDIEEIYFSVNEDIIYYDNSHLSYIYKITINNFEYIFNGFFKDNFFVITLDIYDINLNINIENKNVILLKLDWIIYKINDDKLIWILDSSKLQNNNFESNILKIRQKIFNQQNININDYLKMNTIYNLNLNIKIVNKIITKKKSIFKRIISLFREIHIIKY